MKTNDKRRCETCKFFFRDIDLIPPAHRHRVPGVCVAERCPQYHQKRLSRHGTRCKHWKEYDYAD